MSSFADRFKDKAQIVGKTGEGAMLVQNAPPPAPKRTPSSNNTLSGNRAHRSLLPNEGDRPVVVNGVGSYRDHIRGLANANSTEVQIGSARDRAYAYDEGNRTRGNHYHANTLAEQPQKPMLFGQNKYRSKDEYIPNYKLPEDAPRPEANYTPYSVQDWRQNKDSLAVVKGGVGRLASDTDEQRLYRALRGRVKEFGAETEKINKVALLPENLPRPPKPLTPPPSDEFLEKTHLRHKALEFSKNVPKPRVSPKMSESQGASVRPEEDPDYSDERRMKEAELANLEEQHRREKEAVAAMKKRFAM